MCRQNVRREKEGIHVAVGIEIRPLQQRSILADDACAGTKDDISNNKRQPMQI